MQKLSGIDTYLLKADLTKFAEAYCSAIQEMAVEEITTLAKAAMDEYYKAYVPFYYNPRTDQMRNSSYEPYREKVGNEYRGGIKIDPVFTEHYPSGVSESDIYHYVWEKGIHGFEREGPRGIHLEEPVPIYGKDKGPKNRYEKIDKIVHSRKKRKEFNQKAMDIAKRGSYTMLHF